MNRNVSQPGLESTQDFWNMEDFFKRRKRVKTDDHVAWLITFADLMTILLVFSFVLFIAYQNDPLKPLEQASPEENNASLVPLAHAKTEASAPEPSIPIFFADSALKLEGSDN